MPSYLQQEQLAPVKPFIAPTDAIANTFRERLQYWAMGAAQLKNTYDSYSSLPLTREDNQQAMQGYLDKAHQQIQGAAQTDLSVSDNRSSAMTAFNPINHDSDVMGDYANTRNWNTERAKGDNARTANGGKDFNQASYDAINYQQQLFKNMPKQFTTSDGSTVDSWKVFYSNKEKYTPVYDKTSEIQKLADGFKTDVIDQTAPNGKGYLIGHRDSSWYKDKFQQYIEANASPQLKNQLSIEARADYRRTMLNNLNNPQAVFDQYNKQFLQMNGEKINWANDMLKEIDLKTHNLSKNAPGYADILKGYQSAKKQVQDNLVELNANKLDAGIIDPTKMAYGEQVASSLYTHNYFNKIGASFAHKEIKDTVTSDTAYWANQGLILKNKELQENILEHKDQMDYNYKKLDQEKSLKLIEENNKLLIAGYKLNSKGVPEPLGTDLHKVTSSDKPETDPVKIGEKVYDAYNEVKSKGWATIFDSGLAAKFGDQFVQAINNGGSTPISELRTAGGLGKEQARDVADFLASAMQNTDGFRRATAGVTDPEQAKKKYSDLVMNTPASDVKKKLNDVLGNPRLWNDILQNMSYDEKSLKMKRNIELAQQDMHSTIESFNTAYGPAIKPVFQKLGYPEVVDPESPLGKLGIKGYKQDGEFRIPTKDELEKWGGEKMKQSPITAARQRQYEAMFNSKNFNMAYIKPGGAGSTGELMNVSDPNGIVYNYLNQKTHGTTGNPLEAIAKSSHNAKEFSDKLMNIAYRNSSIGEADMNRPINQIYAAIGAKGSPALNDLEASYNINDKNKQYWRDIIINSLQNTTENLSGDEDKMKGFVLRNIDAVSDVRFITNGISGKPRIAFSLDVNKANTEDKTGVPSNYEKISVETTSDAVPEVFRKANKEYIAALQRPSYSTFNFGMQEKPVTLSLENKGDLANPDFEIKGSYYAPKIDGQNFVYDADGNLEKELIGPDEFKTMLQQITNNKFDDMINTNPVGVYKSAVNNVYAKKEFINYIEKHKPKTISEVPQKLMDAFNSLAQ